MAKIYVKAFAISCGIVTAAVTFVLSTLNAICFIQNTSSRAVMKIYMGSTPTLSGIVLNSLWSFLFAFCVGGVLALVYNRILDESAKEIDETIKVTARTIWEAKGKPQGAEAQNWIEAQKKIRGF